MIGQFRTYAQSKADLENEVLVGNQFHDVTQPINSKTNGKDYPITAESNGVSIYIDEYRGYVNCSTKSVHNSCSNLRIRKHENLTFSKLKNVVKSLEKLNLNIESNKVSQLNMSFTIPVTGVIKEIIQTNIYLHKCKYYNYNKKSLSKHYAMKEFEYTNYTIGFYTVINHKNESYLNIILKLKKSVEFNRKKVLINRIEDFAVKENLDMLFNIFMKKFDEIVMVDNFEEVAEKDDELLKKYLNYRFWEEAHEYKNRQYKSRHFKNFVLILQRNNLDTKKTEIKNQLLKSFKQFIEN